MNSSRRASGEGDSDVESPLEVCAVKISARNAAMPVMYQPDQEVYGTFGHEDECSDEKSRSPGTTTAGVAVFSNATVGAGCLALPFAMKIVGLVPGLCLLVYAAGQAVFSVQLLFITARITSSRSVVDSAAFLPVKHLNGPDC